MLPPAQTKAQGSAGQKSVSLIWIDTTETQGKCDLSKLAEFQTRTR